MEEIEVKFLDIDVKEIENKLQAFGATKIGETISQTTCFDYPDYRLQKKEAWIRLRTEFGKTTLAYKERVGVTSHDGSTPDQGMKEIELSVEDFDLTKNFLLAIGLIEKFLQGRKRIRWQKDDLSFDIDQWPLIPPYIEIEGGSLETIKVASEALGLTFKDNLQCSAHNVFIKYGFNEHDYSVFTLEKQIKKEL